MRLILVDAEHFVSHLNEQGLIVLIKELVKSDYRFVILQPIDSLQSSQNLSSTIETLGLGRYFTFYSYRKTLAPDDFERKLLEHLRLNYSPEEISVCEYLKVSQSESFLAVLKNISTPEAGLTWTSLRNIDSPVVYQGLEAMFYDRESAVGLGLSYSLPAAGWRQYNKALTLLCLSLVLALTMALLAALPPSGTGAVLGVGGSMAKALGMGSFGVGAFSASMGLFVLALCLGLILLVYAVLYFFNQNSVLCCSAIHACFRERRQVSSRELTSAVQLAPVPSTPALLPQVEEPPVSLSSVY